MCPSPSIHKVLILLGHFFYKCDFSTLISLFTLSYSVKILIWFLFPSPMAMLLQLRYLKYANTAYYYIIIFYVFLWFGFTILQTSFRNVITYKTLSKPYRKILSYTYTLHTCGIIRTLGGRLLIWVGLLGGCVFNSKAIIIAFKNRF